MVARWNAEQKKSQMLPDKLCSEKSFPYKMWDSTKWHMYTCVNLAKTYLNEWCISTYLSTKWLLDISSYSYNMVGFSLQKIPVYNFQGCLRWFTIKW